jgi:hypothetical protein
MRLFPYPQPGLLALAFVLSAPLALLGAKAGRRRPATVRVEPAGRRPHQ